MITRVLVANRGEIARRVFRTCRTLGLGAVAVFADPDENALHVRDADLAVRLPGRTAADTYLRGDLIVEAAKRTGADAIHPGYGFLSENAEFAAAVVEAGLIWVGPAPSAIASMGSKISAKALMHGAGVPVLPELDPDTVTPDDLPLLIKAAAGGGGRGMRVVGDLAELPMELDAARAEADAAFGDPTVFCEPYLPTGRHIEVQIVADTHGTVWALGERECSIQRRHQKIIEETPSPLVDHVPGMRESLFDAARTAAKAIDYTGAGTVEFLADDNGNFHFLEMNTRLQVEHPVTECTTGLDLVAAQFEIADGGRLAADPPPRAGHAIEARLYAEDPAAGWLPQTGTLSRVDIPRVDVEFGCGTTAAGLRLDSGVTAGDTVGTNFDPLLAKVIAWAPTRRHAASRLSAALAGARLHGVVTNRDLVVNVLRHAAFDRGETDTAFFDRHGLDILSAPLAGPGSVRLSALAAALALDCSARAFAPVLGGIPSGWRNVPSRPQRITFESETVEYRFGRTGLVADGFADVTLVSATPTEVVLSDAGVRRVFRTVVDGDVVYVDSPLGSVRLRRVPRFVEPGVVVAPGSLRAPMPGTIKRVAVSVGDRVTVGDPVVWLEAMKMQHRVDAPRTGVVTELSVREGQQVDVGAALAVVSIMEIEEDP